MEAFFIGLSSFPISYFLFQVGFLFPSISHLVLYLIHIIVICFSTNPCQSNSLYLPKRKCVVEPRDVERGFSSVKKTHKYD